MKNLVRAGLILSLLGTLVVFIYASTAKMEQPETVENNSQINTEEVNTVAINTEVKDDEKDLVKKTGSVKATGMANRGSFSATAYCFSGRTAMGHAVRRGLVAADPRVLKLGSKIVINAGSYSGTYLVSDIGGGIKGKKLDIWVPSCSEAIRFGRRTVTVFTAQ
ncbi:MAG: 3D domain-containing protein [Acidobacteria bacterium]|nr:3D domain-containing protein [Acidobacteriota bacterium]